VAILKSCICCRGPQKGPAAAIVCCTSSDRWYYAFSPIFLFQLLVGTFVFIVVAPRNCDLLFLGFQRTLGLFCRRTYLPLEMTCLSVRAAMMVVGKSFFFPSGFFILYIILRYFPMARRASCHHRQCANVATSRSACLFIGPTLRQKIKYTSDPPQCVHSLVPGTVS